MSGTGVNAELDVNGRINGGDGGGLYYGGGGGAGIVVTDGAAISLDLGGSVSGGNGGDGDGSGGDGIVAASSSSADIVLQDSAEINGGAGKGVGSGGAGLRLSGGGNVINAGTIQGGDGGKHSRGGGFSGPTGGTGSGGAAGFVSDVPIRSEGGVGIIGADMTIINSGLIAGGTGYFYEQANAITFTGGTNRLELRDGYSFTGNVVASGMSNTLALGGDTSPAEPFDLSKVVDTGTADATDEFIGFEQFEKTGTSTWALTGTGNQDWTIEAGMLVGNTDSFGGDLTFASGVGARGVTFEQTDAGTYAGKISGAGDLNKLDAGTLTLTGVNDVDGNVSVNGGTLAIKDGGTLSNYRGFIGNADGGIDQVAVSGEDSSWTNASHIYLGTVDNGNGALRIEDGASVSNASADIALIAGSTGAVTVSGTGSTWTSSQSIYVGFRGKGSLLVEGGASASTDSGIALGTRVESEGTVMVTGAGSTFSGGGFSIGNEGKATMTIADRGQVSSTNTSAILGYFSDSSGTLNIGAAAGDTAAAAGVLITPSLQFNDGAGTLVFNHTDADYVFSTGLQSIGTGTHVINHDAGTTLLTGDSSGFSGTTTVSGGSLLVGDAAGNGEIGGTVLIEDGGTLGGNGSVGTTAVADGGTIAPGSSIGTLTVNGDLSLASGATLAYELGTPGSADAPGSSDRIAVTGDLALNATLDLAQSDDAGDGAAGLGYYRLMTYGGNLSGDGLQIGTTVDSLNGGYEVQIGDGNVDLFVATLGDDTLQHWQGGDGVWNATNLQWLNRGAEIETTWAGHHAVFKNQPGGFDGGTIAVAGTQGFEGLQFVDEAIA
ncbi:beta strand repeat-containing protein [Paracoccus methylarcula]|uniref:beta strand repeat-containing protein n=1 Tax=Paracoccus methylarcula TaxID=72022 RepID=UPI0011CE5509|nr:autotransporter-associated beta strand repeat-containing protein [Paracoccus methylarcula]